MIWIKLLGLWGWIKDAGARALGWLLASPARLFAALLLLALAWGVWERSGRAAERVRADAWNAAFRAQKAAYIAAQKAALGKELAARKEQADANRKLVAEAGRVRRAAENDARVAVQRYADAHRLRWSGQAAGRSGGEAAAPSVHPDPGQSVDAGPAADMVAVSREDLDRLAAAAVRGAVRQRTLEALVEAGFAMPDPAN